jgi:hypothetical protein
MFEEDEMRAVGKIIQKWSEGADTHMISLRYAIPQHRVAEVIADYMDAKHFKRDHA